MKIYTKTGDLGQTALVGGGRVSKDDLRLECVGTIDELNAAIGVAICQLPEELEDMGRVLVRIQNHLFDIGAEVAAMTEEKSPTIQIPVVAQPKVTLLEQAIDLADEELAPLRTFILPGGHAGACAIHLARTICRRSERRLVSLNQERLVNPYLLKYMNRLSDCLFTFARLVNSRTNIDEPKWQKEI